MFSLRYCSVYPSGFFLCAPALFVNYFAERFGLTRTWRRAPWLGSHTSDFGRRHVFTPATSAMAVASSCFWTGFPHDNLCENDGSEGGDDGAMGDYTTGAGSS